MKDIFQPETLHEVLQRLDRLKPTSQREWGKMDVAQMMAHCSAALEVAVGQKNPPRIFLGRILSPFIKSMFYGPKPFSKNSPTDKSFIITDQRDFDKEKTKLVELIKQFSTGGEEKVTKHPHSFFGKLTPQQWSIGYV